MKCQVKGQRFDANPDQEISNQIHELDREQMYKYFALHELLSEEFIRENHFN